MEEPLTADDDGARSTSSVLSEAINADLVASPRRRKRNADEDLQSVPSKKSRFFEDSRHYQQLLEETIQEVTTGHSFHDEDSPLEPSRVGASSWTAQEKNEFFKAITVLGKDDIRAVAARLKTKSAFEVASYRRLLQQSLADLSVSEDCHELVEYFELPAAQELSHDCCEQLDQAAASLRKLEQRGEQSSAEQEQSNFWLLTPKVASKIESKLADKDEGQQVAATLPAAQLLKLESWLTLAREVFMNPGPPRVDDNWQTVATSNGDGELELPSIYKDAFQDFANLAVSMTERLVQATLFQAMSRCRAMHSKHFTDPEGFSVQAEDVWGACDLLKLQCNSRSFWTYAPRRCGLCVYRKVTHRANEAERMSYEEVERELGGKPITKARRQVRLARGADDLGRSGPEDRAESLSAVSGREESSPFRSTESKETELEPELENVNNLTSDDENSTQATTSVESTSSRNSICSTDSDSSYQPRTASDLIDQQWQLAQEQETYMEALERRWTVEMAQSRRPITSVAGALGPSSSSSSSTSSPLSSPRSTTTLPLPTLPSPQCWSISPSRISSSGTAVGKKPRTQSQGRIPLPSKPPPRQPEDPANIVDWRARTEYRAEWETLERPSIQHPA